MVAKQVRSGHLFKLIEISKCSLLMDHGHLMVNPPDSRSSCSSLNLRRGHGIVFLGKTLKITHSGCPHPGV